MLLDGTSTTEIAAVLRAPPEEVEHAVRRILAALSTQVRV
jgi:DNA-directed RNA polymerase specialized sigma24 family protein